jgi:hypothetical protein
MYTNTQTFAHLSILFETDIRDTILQWWGPPHECWRYDIRELCLLDVASEGPLEDAAQTIVETNNIHLFQLIKRSGRYNVRRAIAESLKRGYLELALTILYEEEQCDQPIPLEAYLMFLNK